jgi:hypothetical protein
MEDDKSHKTDEERVYCKSATSIGKLKMEVD